MQYQTVTAVDGPSKGQNFRVPPGTNEFGIGEVAEGLYRIDDKECTWTGADEPSAEKGQAETKPAPRRRLTAAEKRAAAEAKAAEEADAAASDDAPAEVAE